MRRKAPKTKDFHIYLPADLADLVKDVAEIEGRSVNGQLKYWITFMLKRYTSQGK